MTARFITRHPGAREWALRLGLEAGVVAHLDPGTVAPGDIVMGTLPVHLAAAVCARGGRYLHLTLDLPPEARGRDLTADEMAGYGARLTEYVVTATAKGDGA